MLVIHHRNEESEIYSLDKIFCSACSSKPAVVGHQRNHEVNQLRKDLWNMNRYEIPEKLVAVRNIRHNLKREKEESLKVLMNQNRFAVT